MESVQTEKCACEPDKCDTFQFMAKKLNMNVLHPGGIWGTELLAEHSKISENMTILDAGCGSGSSSIFLARKYGCKVVGIDIDQNSLTKAYRTVRKKDGWAGGGGGGATIAATAPVILISRPTKAVGPLIVVLRRRAARVRVTITSLARV